MPAKKAVSTVKAEIAKDPATFDVAGWLDGLAAQGFKPRNVKVPMLIRGDLVPRIKQLVDQIQAADDEERQVGVNDDDPLAEAIAEYDRLVTEFREGGSIVFEFRPMVRKLHNSIWQDWKAEVGDEPSDEDLEDLTLRRMAAHCVDYPGRSDGQRITADAFRAFEDHFGSPAFNTLVQGFREAYDAGGEVDAPFSPIASRTRDTAG